MAFATKSRGEIVLQKHYDELVSKLSTSIDEILRGLMSRGVISITDKNNIKEYGKVAVDKAEYLLDHYIERSVAAGINDSLIKLLDVMKEIPQCNPLAVSVEQDLIGAPAVGTRDDVDGEGNKAINELTRQVEKLKSEEITQLRQEIEILRQQGTKHIERLQNVTSIHSQEEIHKERSTVPTAKVQQPVADSQVDIFSKTIKWEELPPLPLCRYMHTAVLLGRSVYVGGGFEERKFIKLDNSYRIDVYNLSTNQWSPSPITTPYCWFAMTVLDDKLVIAGGRTKNIQFVKQVLVFNAGQWEDYSEMPTARACATAVGYHSMLIVVGGRNSIFVSTTELLDTTNGCWYTCNNLPTPHQQLKAVIMNDKLYLLGGINKDLNPSPQVFVASLKTLSTHQLNWESARNTPWCYCAPVALNNEFLVTIGGCQQRDMHSNSSEVNVFNRSTGQWKHLTNIPLTRACAAVVGVADNIIVMGGVTNHDHEFSATVWVGVLS